jgi:hypothetical protein
MALHGFAANTEIFRDLSRPLTGSNQSEYGQLAIAQ